MSRSRAHDELRLYLRGIPEPRRLRFPVTKTEKLLHKLEGVAETGALPAQHWTESGLAEVRRIEQLTGIPADSWPMPEDDKPDPLPPGTRVDWSEGEWERIEDAAGWAVLAVIKDGVANWSHLRQEALSEIRLWAILAENQPMVRRCLNNYKYMRRTLEGRVKMFLRERKREAERVRRNSFKRPWFYDLGELRGAVVDTLTGVQPNREVDSALKRLKKSRYQQYDVLVEIAKIGVRDESGKAVVDYGALEEQLGKAARDREKYALRELQKKLENPVYSNAQKIEGEVFEEADFPFGQPVGQRDVTSNSAAQLVVREQYDKAA